MSSPIRKYEIKNTVEFTERVLQNNVNPAIVIFGAEWSGNGQLLLDIVEHILSETDESIELYHIDVDENEDILDTMRIQSIPTTLIFHQGEVIDYFRGILSRNKIRSRIDNLFKGKNEDY